MSTDWNIHCVDCNSTHMFSDANHQEDLMRVLIRHRDAIASIAPLLAESRSDIEFGTHWGSIDASWFAEHKGHKLQPINEYGRLDDQCRESVPCECGLSGVRRARTAGVLKLGHDGKHTAKGHT